MTGNNQKKASPDKWKMLSWWLLSFIAPAFMAAFIALILLQKTNLSFEIAMPIMMGVSAIAAIIHYRTLKQPTRTRLFAHGGYAILLIAFSFGLYQGFSIQHDKLLTCPVCGFRTLEATHDLCKICNVEVSQEAVIAEDYSSIEEYIRAEQLMYFLPKNAGEKVDFFVPYPGKEGYQKDKNWKPSITKEDIEEIVKLTK